MEEVYFESGGLRCAADLYLPSDLQAGERRAALVIGHGFSLVKPMLAEQAACFCQAGFIVLAIDYRSFGNSEGEPRGQLFPLNEAEDYRNAISYLQSRDDVDAERIGIWGASFAGAQVSYVAAIDRRVKAAVAVVPVTDGYKWMKLLRSEAHFDELLVAVEADRAARYVGQPSARIPVVGAAGDLCGMPVDQDIIDFYDGAKTAFPTWADSITLESIERILEFSPMSYVHRISPRPYLIISTAHYDVVHPAWSIAELYEHAREPKRLEFLPFAQVGLYSEPGLSVSNNLARDFFIEQLGPAALA
jgi:alpha/beta superfamily hydrolase